MITTDLNKNGFSKIKIPKILINHLSKSIINDLNYKLFKNEKKIKGFNVIQKSILKMSNSLFLNTFGHTAQRHLTSNIITKLNSWVEDQAKKKFKVSKACIPYVVKSDVLINKSLKTNFFQVWYRIVRFNKKKDVGFPHRDNDFLKVGGKRFGKIKPSEKLKIWIPIWGCNKKNNLRLIRGSHLDRIKISLVKKNGRIKPKISDKYIKENIKNCVSGIDNKSKLNAVLFGGNTIHFAPKNISSKLRISAEFTVFTK